MPSSFGPSGLLQRAKTQLAIVTIDMKRFSRRYRGKPFGVIARALRKRLPGQSRATICRMAWAVHNGHEVTFTTPHRAGRSRARRRGRYSEATRKTRSTNKGRTIAFSIWPRISP
jgi:hypothetical protein